MYNKKVLVIIVTYNASKWVERCFHSLVHSSYPVDIIVIDNASTDATLSIIKKVCPKTIIVESGKNMGFGGANNIGLRYAIKNGYDYVYLLNQDAWIEKDTISTLIIAFNQNPSLGVISPTQMSKSGKIDRGFMAQIIKDANLPFTISALLSKSNNDVLPLDKFPAAHWMLSMKCIKKVGFFSPVFFHYGEDSDYMRRIHYHGYYSGFSPLTKCVHDREFRKGGDFGDIIYFHYLNIRLMASDVNNSKMKAFLFCILYTMILPFYYVIINVNHLFSTKSKSFYKKIISPLLIWKYYLYHKSAYLGGYE